MTANATMHESARTRSFWQRMRRLNSFVIRRLQHGRGPQRTVLLLTTKGRRTGLPRVTPLQFEVEDGIYYVASGRGAHADWFRNLTADPAVLVEVSGKQFAATAEPVIDTRQIAEFLALRLRRHPLMVRAIMVAEGLPLRYSPQDLEAFASQKTMVVLRPLVPTSSEALASTRRRFGVRTIALGTLFMVIGILPAYLMWVRRRHKR